MENMGKPRVETLRYLKAKTFIYSLLNFTVLVGLYGIIISLKIHVLQVTKTAWLNKEFWYRETQLSERWQAVVPNKAYVNLDGFQVIYFLSNQCHLTSLSTDLRINWYVKKKKQQNSKFFYLLFILMYLPCILYTVLFQPTVTIYILTL
jgi:hypothetical protein